MIRFINIEKTYFFLPAGSAPDVNFWTVVLHRILVMLEQDRPKHRQTINK